MRELIRLICKSRVYQHSMATNRWNADDETNYSHALARRLPAEVALRRHPPGDRLAGAAAGQADARPSSPGRPGRRAARRIPGRSSAARRARVPASASDPAAFRSGQALNLINGPTVAEAINDPNNAIARLVASQHDDRKLIEELFLRVLCRPPTEAEIGRIACKLLDAYDEDLPRSRAAADVEKSARRPAAGVGSAAPRHRSLWHESSSPVETGGRRRSHATKQPGGAILAGGTSAGERQVHGHDRHRPDRDHRPAAGGLFRRQPAGQGAGPGG